MRQQPTRSTLSSSSAASDVYKRQYKYKSEIISDETAFYTNEKKEISGICNQFLNGKTDQKLFCNEMKDRLNDYYGSRYELRNQSEAVEGRVSNMLSKLQHMYAL